MESSARLANSRLMGISFESISCAESLCFFSLVFAWGGDMDFRVNNATERLICIEISCFRIDYFLRREFPMRIDLLRYILFLCTVY